MNNIKTVSIFIFLLSIALTTVSIYISQQNRLEVKAIDTINKQKAFTQEISKNIFYLYKKQKGSNKELESSIKNYIHYVNTHKNELDAISSEKLKNTKIVKLWNKFYLSVQNFRDINKVTTMYSNIILEKIVNNIYNTNLMLIVEFDNLIQDNQFSFDKHLSIVKDIQYFLFFLLFLMLTYLFTKIKIIISFMQKFLNTSKNIITNSTIKDLKPISIKNNEKEILEASNNFNFLVEKINTSIQTSTESIEHTYKSLEHVEKNIEDIFELIYSMNDTQTDKDLTKKEDAIIQSLEELTTSAQNLKSLKTEIDNLVSTHNLKK